MRVFQALFKVYRILTDSNEAAFIKALMRLNGMTPEERVIVEGISGKEIRKICDYLEQIKRNGRLYSAIRIEHRSKHQKYKANVNRRENYDS